MQVPLPDADHDAPQRQEAFFGQEMSLWAKITNAVVLFALIFGAALFLWLMSSLPRIEGRVPIKGLDLPVTVARDHNGIPHITARTLRDAYFSMGWVHAQDRLWQMEMQRRVGAGRLAEAVGPAGLSNDRYMRTLGVYRLAQASFDLQDRPTRDALIAYTDGVNSWLRDHWHRLPPEFVALGLRPEPWTPADSLVWGRLMALQLTNDWREEVLRGKLAATLDAKRLKELWPDAAAEAPVKLGAATTDNLLAAIPESATPHLASNVWAVDGKHSTSGLPLLANDPHLGLRAPILWYLMAVDAPGLSLSGATVPGVPFHMIGHNGRVAWGITSSYADTVDLFQEKTVGAGEYLTPDGPAPFVERDEVIKVKGQDDVTLKVRTTRHGPVISDLLPPGTVQPGYAVALRSTALETDDLSPQAMYRLGRSIDWKGFSAALRDLSAPAINFAYADTAGTIAFQTAGKVPVRKGNDGTLPLAGWLRQNDWGSWLTQDKLPQQINPKSGLIVNANNRLTSPKGAPAVATLWPESYRAERITSLLESQPKLTPKDMAAFQLDTLSLGAVEMKELLGEPEVTSPKAREAAALLARWNGDADRDRPEALIFSAWTQQVWHDLLADELGENYASFASVRPQILGSILTSHRHWCDDKSQSEARSCETLIGQAFEKAVSDLISRHGPDMAHWRWGSEHALLLEHPVFSRVPLLGSFMRREMATSGDDFTVNRGTYAPDSFAHVHGAGLRVVYDLADLSASRFIIAGGQSGNPLSRHYDDMLEDWRDNIGHWVGRRADSVAVMKLEPGY